MQGLKSFAEMEGAHFVVERIDPRATRPDLTDETRECEDFPSLKAQWEDMAARGSVDAHDEAAELAGGIVDVLEHVDPETGVEVTARRA